MPTTPTEYYTSIYSGEEIDNAVDRSRTGGAIDTALSNKADKEPPQEYDLPLSDGVKGNISYFLDGCGYVGLRGVFQFNALPTPEQVIGTLPMGFRPTGATPIQFQAARDYSMYGYVQRTGVVQIANTNPSPGFTVGTNIAIIGAYFFAENLS